MTMRRWCFAVCIRRSFTLDCSTELNNCNIVCSEGRKPAEHARFSCHSDCVDLLQAACGVTNDANDSDANEDGVVNDADDSDSNEE